MGRTEYDPDLNNTAFVYEFAIGVPPNEKHPKALYPGQERKIKFDGKVQEEKKPKVYIIAENDKIIYIGGTRGKLSTRLNAGLRDYKNRNKSGARVRTYPYKWKSVEGPLKLIVPLLPPEYDNQIKVGLTPHGIEAIEGELAYLVKKHSEWPLYQHEIHFHTTNQITQRSVIRIADFLRNNAKIENIDNAY